MCLVENNNRISERKKKYDEIAKGAFIYDVRFLGRQVSQAASDFTIQAYVVKYLISVGWQV